MQRVSRHEATKRHDFSRITPPTCRIATAHYLSNLHLYSRIFLYTWKDAINQVNARATLRVIVFHVFRATLENISEWKVRHKC